MGSDQGLPRVFMETADMRNRGDASLIESPRFRERIARSIAAGLARFLSRCWATLRGLPAQKVEQLADLMLELLGMPHAALAVEHVPIAATDALALKVAGVDQVVDDALGRSLGYTDRARDVAHADIWVSLDGQQHLRVAREEVPRAAFYFRTWHTWLFCRIFPVL
jgi:hypothetical protein